MKLVVAGGGYVGLATAVGFGRHGHQIELIEIDAARAERLRRGELPFDEPSLGEDLALLSGQSLTVHSGYPDAFGDVDFAFVCVDTHTTEAGDLDSTQVMSAADSLIDCCGPDVVLVLRSTVNPGTATMLREHRAERGAPGVPCWSIPNSFVKARRSGTSITHHDGSPAAATPPPWPSWFSSTNSPTRRC